MTPNWLGLFGQEFGFAYRNHTTEFLNRIPSISGFNMFKILDLIVIVRRSTFFSLRSLLNCGRI